MKNMKTLVAIVMTAAVALGASVHPAWAGDTGTTPVMAEIERVVGEIKQVNEDLVDLSNRIAKTGAFVKALSDTFDKTGDPALVVDELAAAEATLASINAELDETSGRLATARNELNAIRGTKLTKPAAKALRDAFEALRTVERSQFDAEVEADTVAFEIDVLKDKISQA